MGQRAGKLDSVPVREFDRLVRTSEPVLLRVAERTLKGSGREGAVEPRDLVQKVFAKAWSGGLLQGVPRDRWVGFLARAVRYEALHLVRDEATRQRATARAADEGRLQDHPRFIEALTACAELRDPLERSGLPLLTSAEREVARLVILDDLSVREAAERLGKARNTVRELLRRARAKLRPVVGRVWGPSPTSPPPDS